ncbi:MAG: hypothetical protein ACP5UV_06720 [Thermoplasmata archaeon]
MLNEKVRNTEIVPLYGEAGVFCTVPLVTGIEMKFSRSSIKTVLLFIFKPDFSIIIELLVCWMLKSLPITKADEKIIIAATNSEKK